jgi:DnaK suppressor protein
MKKEYETLLSQLKERKKELAAAEEAHASERLAEIEAPHGDELDVAEQATEKELSMTLRHRSTLELQQIEEAIEKMRSGEYGVCENCEDEIGKNRLQARPFVKYCIDCQTELEQKEDEDTSTTETYKLGTSD